MESLENTTKIPRKTPERGHRDFRGPVLLGPRVSDAAFTVCAVCAVCATFAAAFAVAVACVLVGAPVSGCLLLLLLFLFEKQNFVRF